MLTLESGYARSLLLKLFALCLLASPALSLAADSKNVGAVASGHPLATKAGLEVLEKGGNAFDAAIAVASTLSVVEPSMSGLGGYSSTLIYDAATQKIRFLNGSGKFPLKINSELMRPPTTDYMANRKGPKSISTPSNLNSWHVMHKQYGKMPWQNLFNSAIKYSKNGFPISAYTEELITSVFDQFSDYSKSFYGIDGRPLKEGELLIQKDLAKTYEIIAAKGVKPFYKGQIAELIDKQMREHESFLSIEDLKADKAEWFDPLKINYKGYDVYTMGTPGNGFSALFTLGVLEQFNLQKLDHNSSEYLHLFVEAIKESVKVRLTNSGAISERDNIVNHILTHDNFVKIANSINMTNASKLDLNYNKEGLNTTHFVVVDKWGNIVSSTQTLGTRFGSKVMIEGTGIWMNNSMAFSQFEPKGNPMDVLPGQYKMSSNSPMIIMKDNKPWAALGTPGGHTIPQNVAQIVVNLIDFNMNMQAAIDSPKIAFFEEDNSLVFENGISESVIIALRKKEHNVVDNKNIASYIGTDGRIGNAMGVKILDNKKEVNFDVGIDKRKDGWSTNHLLLEKH